MNYKKITIIFSLIFFQLSVNLFGQDTIQKKIYWGVSFSIQKTTNNNNQILNQVFENEIPINTYSVGIKGLYFFNRKISFESGLYYSQYKQNRFIPESSSLIETSLGVNEINTEFTYGNITIPIVLNYNFYFNKVSIYTGLGFLPQILIKIKQEGSSEQEYFNVKKMILEQTEYNIINLSYTFKLGSSYKINSNFSIFIEANLQGMLFPLKTQEYSGYFDPSNPQLYHNSSAEGIIEEYLFSYGLLIGILF